MSGLNPREYLMLPWAIKGPVRVVDEHGQQYFEMRVGELPDFLVAGATEAEVLYEFKDALFAFLESYTSHGEVPPHPVGKATAYDVLTMRHGRPASVLDAPSTSGTAPVALQLA